jgi:RIO-like serine/threonine protein kinase
LVNVINGLFKFYKNGIYHSDVHEGNIVFPLDNPEKMRIIDWGYLLKKQKAWNTNYKIKMNLHRFFNIFSEFINTKGISDKVRNIFAQIKNIPEFTEYKKFPNQSNQSDFKENPFIIIKEKMLKKISELLRT